MAYYQDTDKKIQAHLNKRLRKEKIFKACGLGAIFLAFAILFVLLASTFVKGKGAFFQSEIRLNIVFEADKIIGSGEASPENIAKGDFSGLLKSALLARFPDVTKRRDKKNLYALISPNASHELRDYVMENKGVIGEEKTMWVLASDDVDMYLKGNIQRKSDGGILNDSNADWLHNLQENNEVRTKFNWRFLINTDSREPEAAGILGAVIGSFWLIFVTLILSFPIGIMTSIYLEEFAPKNKLTDIIEVNINTLASVPSIVFGLLGLAIFLNFFQLPRSSPLVGGMVLTLMTLPTIIIASRAALRAVPPSIREAALGIGASKVQMVLHHVLPLSLPGMLTGTIIGLAQALGESAPLIMIGMVAFIIDLPVAPTDPAAALPVQIFLWSDSPERAFVEKTAAAILVLLVFLGIMNALAVVLRKKLEHKW